MLHTHVPHRRALRIPGSLQQQKSSLASHEVEPRIRPQPAPHFRPNNGATMPQDRKNEI